MRRAAPAARARVVALLASIVAVTPALATPGDPLESSECRRALAALNSQETAVTETSGASAVASADDRRLIAAKLTPARREAAPAARTTVQSPLRWSDSAEWKLDYCNIARLGSDEIARRRAEFDAGKAQAKALREGSA